MSRFLEVAALVSLLALGACGKTKDKEDEKSVQPSADQNPAELPGVASEHGLFRVSLTWRQGPSFDLEDNQFDLAFFDAEGKAITGVKVAKVFPWMTSMGHGAPTIDLQWANDEAVTNQTVVKVVGVMFTMGGTWDMKVTATLADASDDAAIAVDVPK